MLENVQFFAFTLKVRKRCFNDQKFSSLKKINMGIKNAEFYASFKSVNDDFKKMPV